MGDQTVRNHRSVQPSALFDRFVAVWGGTACTKQRNKVEVESLGPKQFNQGEPVAPQFTDRGLEAHA